MSGERGNVVRTSDDRCRMIIMISILIIGWDVYCNDIVMIITSILYVRLELMIFFWWLCIYIYISLFLLRCLSLWYCVILCSLAFVELTSLIRVDDACKITTTGWSSEWWSDVGGCTAGYFRQRKRDSNTWRGFKMFQVWFAYCCLNVVTRFHRLCTTYTCAIKCWTFMVLYIPYVYIYIQYIQYIRIFMVCKLLNNWY